MDVDPYATRLTFLIIIIILAQEPRPVFLQG